MTNLIKSESVKIDTSNDIRSSVLLRCSESFLLKSIRNISQKRFFNVELIAVAILDNKIIEAYVKDTREKVPFVIDVYKYKVVNF